jgi:Flp pilus assembly protein TadG
MVEMALVMALLLLLILGGVDALQILMTQYSVSQAVRASVHQAALIGGPEGSNGKLDGQANGQVAETARLILDSGMMTDAAHATITVSCARTPCRRYDPITVRITYEQELWAPIGPFSVTRADIQAVRAAEKDSQ